MSSKLILALLATGLLLASCSRHGRSSAYSSDAGRKQMKFLPAEVRDLYLGMPMAEATKKHPNMEEMDAGADFRTVYYEKLDEGKPDAIVYYFDRDGNLPLYEIIAVYDSEEERDKDAQKLLGRPNHEDGEWMLESGEGFRVHAWTFQKKLIIVGKIDNTEWAESEGEGTRVKD